MEYYLINPAFADAPLKITNNKAVDSINRDFRETLDTKIGKSLIIKIDRMLYKLILEEKSKESYKFRLISNIYL